MTVRVVDHIPATPRPARRSASSHSHRADHSPSDDGRARWAIAGSRERAGPRRDDPRGAVTPTSGSFRSSRGGRRRRPTGCCRASGPWRDCVGWRRLAPRPGRRLRRRARCYGDEVLIEIGRVLRSGRSEDRAFRIGGDEFAIVFAGTDGASAKTALERMLVAAQTGTRPTASRRVSRRSPRYPATTRRRSGNRPTRRCIRASAAAAGGSSCSTTSPRPVSVVTTG